MRASVERRLAEESAFILPNILDCHGAAQGILSAFGVSERNLTEERDGRSIHIMLGDDRKDHI